VSALAVRPITGADVVATVPVDGAQASTDAERIGRINRETDRIIGDEMFESAQASQESYVALDVDRPKQRRNADL
jgi:hypothetical protein